MTHLTQLPETSPPSAGPPSASACSGHAFGCGCTTRRRLLLQGLAGLASAGLLAGCSENALGRDTLQLVSDEQLEDAAARAWQDLKATKRQSNNQAYRARARRVGYDMIQAAGIGGNPEIIVIEDSSPNAFVLPGAKIAVHTGMMQIATSDDELAAVLGHEVGHVVAKHANERVSQQGLAELLISGATRGGERAGLAKVLGLGATLGVLLPYGRRQELEADRLGVRYAARGGYDPRGGLTLWNKMSKLGGGAPEFLSTHPGASDRKRVIEAEIAKL